MPKPVDAEERPRYFDANSAVGANTFGHGAPELSLEGLIEEMDHAGITASLVYHYVAREFSPRKGNERLANEMISMVAADRRRLHACAIWCPSEEGYGEDAVEKARELRAGGFLAVRAYPAEFNFTLDPRIMSDHFLALSNNRLPLFIESGQIGWTELITVLEAFPSLNIVLSGEMYRTGRIIVPLMRKYSNFYFETCGFETHRGIEELTGAAGSGQLLFSSRIPEFAPGPAKMMIDFALLEHRHKAAVAGENLARLLGVEIS